MVSALTNIQGESVTGVGAYAFGTGAEVEAGPAAPLNPLRSRLSAKDQALVDLFLEENGNFSAVARRLHRDRSGTSKRFKNLFRRCQATTSAN